VTVTIGADPEIFFAKGDELVSAVGYIGGDKWAPKLLGNGFAILEDNVAGEFNIPPADNYTAFDNNIVIGMNALAEVALKNNMKCSMKAYGYFSDKELDSDAARLFGCEPDYNAWTRWENEPPSADKNFRSAGGHVHVGCKDADPVAIIRAMDLFLGVPSVILDKDKDRRSLYGKAGSFRYKPYGCEYRTLSNFWIFEPRYREWVFSTTNKAVEFARKIMNAPDSALGEVIVDTINNSNPDGYYGLIEEFPEISVKDLIG